METNNTGYSPEVEAAVNQFIEFRQRFSSEWTSGEKIEAFLKEVRQAVVDGLIQTEGDPTVMEAFELEFIAPLLAEADPSGLRFRVFRNLLGSIATDVAQRLSQRQ